MKHSGQNKDNDMLETYGGIEYRNDLKLSQPDVGMSRFN